MGALALSRMGQCRLSCLRCFRKSALKVSDFLTKLGLYSCLSETGETLGKLY